MRIVIDGRMMGPRWTGIGLYTQKLIENLGSIDHDNQYLILVDHQNFEGWSVPGPNVTKILAPYKIYSLSEQLLLPFKIWGLKPDLVHFLHNVPIIFRGQRVVMIHDTTMVDFNLAPAGWLPGLKYQIKRLAMRLVFRASAGATQIIVPSQATKDRLIALLNVPSSRVRVIYEAAPNNEALSRKLDLKHPSLLYVGTLFPYKNLGVVLEAMARLIKSRPDLKLKVIGSTPRFNQAAKHQVDQLGLSQHVDLAGFVSDAAKTSAYRAASLFIFPSLSEGFGLPPLEAICEGLPVLAARASALPEVLGDGADYFDPHDPADLANQVDRLLSDEPALIKLQDRGARRLKHFSWKQMAAETLAVYKEIKPV